MTRHRRRWPWLLGAVAVYLLLTSGPRQVGSLLTAWLGVIVVCGLILLVIGLFLSPYLATGWAVTKWAHKRLRRPRPVDPS
jgi:hypothetical protein